MRYTLKNAAAIVVLGLGISGTVAVGAAPQTAADNSKANTRDRAKGAVTADQQKDNGADRKLTQSIRQALMSDKTLSSYAHNVKIITQGGEVVLKGPVRTEEEKRTVEAAAIQAAGTGHVTNQLTIAKTGK
jgi:osmotically-inducible protein OsmY